MLAKSVFDVKQYPQFSAFLRILIRLLFNLFFLDFYRIWCKGLAFLCTLLGVTWLVGLVYMESDLPQIIEYLFVLLNGLQGVYIFIFQCVLNNQVRPVLVQFFMRRNRKIHHSSFSQISVSAIVFFS